MIIVYSDRLGYYVSRIYREQLKPVISSLPKGSKSKPVHVNAGVHSKTVIVVKRSDDHIYLECNERTFTFG